MMNDKAPEFWVRNPDKVKGEPMETQQTINWLRDKACRADNLSWTRMMNIAAKMIHELSTENDKLKQRLNELDKPKKTGHWIIHITSDDILAECSECRVCGNPNWKVCPVCETRMVKYNAED